MPRILSILFFLAVAPAIAAGQIPPLTLETAVQLYLDRNIEVEAARVQLARARAEQIGANLRPNPVLTASAENLKFSGPEAETFGGLRELHASYQERIELGGKRRLRTEVA